MWLKPIAKSIIVFWLLKVMCSERLEEQLQESVEEYLHHWADIQAGKVIVPYLVKRYIQSTGQNIHVFLRDSLNRFMLSQYLDLPGSKIMGN